VASRSFFLSPRGATDPSAELDATLDAFFKESPDPDKAAQCRFPSRWDWLKRRLSFDPERLPERDCPKFQEFRRLVGTAEISMVFADAYLNNPSSMYGHTFLVARRQGESPKDRLLDTAVNFAADAGDSDNGVLFAVYGLAGVYPGKFSAMPYYLQVQEYNNLESRDLWEYKLNLSSSAVERLVMHLWDLGDATFDYYFFNKNCSWQLMPLLDVAEPSLHLADHWPLYLVPGDTVRRIAEAPGLVAQRRYRPSHVSQLMYHRSLLTKDELKAVENGSIASSTPSALGLWTASEYLEYQIDYRRNPDPRLLSRQRDVHIAMGQLGAQAPPPDPPPGPPPESGHDTARLGLGAGFQNRSGFQEFSARATLHDFLDSPNGYVPSSSLEMFGLRVRYRDYSNRAWIEALDLVRILSLSPLDPWMKKPSWEVDFGLRNASELGQAPWDSDYFGITLGSGLSLRSRVAGTETWYALAETDGGAGDIFHHGHRVGLGGTVGVLLEPSKRWRTKLDASYYDYVAGDTRNQGRLRLESNYDLTKDWSLRLRLQSYGIVDEEMLSILHYF
jgi:hypothetical protein